MSQIRTYSPESVYLYFEYMTGYAGSRVYVGTPPSPWRTSHISVYPNEKQTPTLSQEFCAGCGQFEVISNPHRTLARGSEFFSGMCGYVWGPLQRLRGPYVIPRPGVSYVTDQDLELKIDPRFLNFSKVQTLFL